MKIEKLYILCAYFLIAALAINCASSNSGSNSNTGANFETVSLTVGDKTCMLRKRMSCAGADTEGEVTTLPITGTAPAAGAEDTRAFTINGVIGCNTPAVFEAAVKANPTIKRLVFERAPGSSDDDSNLGLLSLINCLDFSTEVPATGVTFSGGTDLFLAGKTRRADRASCIGVHAWAGNNIVASALSRDNAEHNRYINAYTEVGYSAAIARAFYFMTINVAPPEGNYFLPPCELNCWGIVPMANITDTTSVTYLTRSGDIEGITNPTDARRRSVACEARLAGDATNGRYLTDEDRMAPQLFTPYSARSMDSRCPAGSTATPTPFNSALCQGAANLEAYNTWEPATGNAAAWHRP